jgi:hypothetical protein
MTRLVAPASVSALLADAFTYTSPQFTCLSRHLARFGVRSSCSPTACWREFDQSTERERAAAWQGRAEGSHCPSILLVTEYPEMPQVLLFRRRQSFVLLTNAKHLSAVPHDGLRNN